jgi:hypothetical protein
MLVVKIFAAEQPTTTPRVLSGYCQEIDGMLWLNLSFVDARLRELTQAWSTSQNDVESASSKLFAIANGSKKRGHPSKVAPID